MRAGKRNREANAKTNDGECVVLVGPDGRGKELLIASARRRFCADASFEFPERISTRGCDWDDKHICVTRSAFRDLEASGALFASWRSDGHAMALPVSVGASLKQGRVIVFAAPEDVAAALATHGLAVRVVEVAAGPDRVRARAAATRGANSARFAERDVVHHGGDLAEAVRRFHAILLALRLHRLSSQVPLPGRGLASNARQLVGLQRTRVPRESLRVR